MKPLYIICKLTGEIWGGDRTMMLKPVPGAEFISHGDAMEWIAKLDLTHRYSKYVIREVFEAM